jgi:hypothetical protein
MTGHPAASPSRQRAAAATGKAGWSQWLITPAVALCVIVAAYLVARLPEEQLGAAEAEAEADPSRLASAPRSTATSSGGSTQQPQPPAPPHASASMDGPAREEAGGWPQCATELPVLEWGRDGADGDGRGAGDATPTATLRQVSEQPSEDGPTHLLCCL